MHDYHMCPNYRNLANRKNQCHIYTRIHGFKKNSSCTKRGLCKLVSVEVLIFYLRDSKLGFRSKLDILKGNDGILSSKFANIVLSKTISMLRII